MFETFLGPASTETVPGLTSTTTIEGPVITQTSYVSITITELGLTVTSYTTVYVTPTIETDPLATALAPTPAPAVCTPTTEGFDTDFIAQAFYTDANGFSYLLYEVDAVKPELMTLTRSGAQIDHYQTNGAQNQAWVPLPDCTTGV